MSNNKFDRYQLPPEYDNSHPYDPQQPPQPMTADQSGKFHFNNNNVHFIPTPMNAGNQWNPESNQPVHIQPQIDHTLLKKKEDMIKDTLSKEYNEIKNDQNDNRNKSADLQNDERSPLYSQGTFKQFGLPNEIIKALYNMNFTKPTRIQETTLTHLFNKKRNNLLAQSQSGTGKTATFILAALRTIDPKEKYPQVLIVCPTYELALQVGNVANKLSIHIPELSIAYAVRADYSIPFGTKLEHQLVIGTPGTLENWIINHKMLDPKKLKMFILDEADVMISERGHQTFTLNLKQHLDSNICQILLFSATYTDEVKNFAKKIIPKAVAIELPKDKQVLDNIIQYYVRCRDDEEKFRVIHLILSNVTIGQTITFCHRRSTAKALSERILQYGFSVGLLSADLTIEQRRQVIQQFREGDIRFLISTNVTARGIDIEQVNLVLNYDLPLMDRQIDLETYVHRIGRTGRFGRRGIAINFCRTEREYEMIKQIEQYFNIKIAELSPTSEVIRQELDSY
ncbi:hypothetical protein SNEBB_004973 [Seison nebaliae]|nr:hypothetical protein SNEBB_004973 [Seison nebaliae]